MKSPIFLLDMMNLIYRYHWAFHKNPLKSSSGEITSSAYGIANLLFDIRSRYRNPVILGAYDSGSTKRKALYPEYKSTRKHTLGIPEQTETSRTLLSAHGIPQIKNDGVEADDIIAVLSRYYSEIGHEVFIVSNDLDFGQLLSPLVKMLKHGKDGKFSFLTVDNFAAEHGVSPDKYLDFLAITGDPSDNIPGVKGIGEIGAKALINDYGSLDGVYENIESIKKNNIKDKLLASKTNAFLSRELIRPDWEIEVPVNESWLTPEPDFKKILDLYVLWDFMVMTKKIREDLISRNV